MVTTGLTKQDSFKSSSQCSLCTLSCCSYEGYTYTITCVPVEAGLIPSLYFTLLLETSITIDHVTSRGFMLHFEKKICCFFKSRTKKILQLNATNYLFTSLSGSGYYMYIHQPLHTILYRDLVAPRLLVDPLY